jgi:hypothetical protein
MTPTPSKTSTLWQIIAIVTMSVGLGVLFLTAFDKWLRGDSFIWWLALCAVFVFSISANVMALLKRIS